VVDLVAELDLHAQRIQAPRREDHGHRGVSAFGPRGGPVPVKRFQRLLGAHAQSHALAAASSA